MNQVANLGYDATVAKLEFELSDEIMVISSFYVYDGLSMVAEIGGYVGLFLGLIVQLIVRNLGLHVE